MPPTSPEREIDPHENVLNQVRSLDDERRCDVRAQLFMNQLHDAENQAIIVQFQNKGLLVVKPKLM